MSEITLIIPLYNAVRHLKMTLDSVVEQTYKDFEVLLINDGSTDNTVEFVTPYCEKYPNFHLITQQNGGVSAARNRGLEEAQTPYVAFLDQDDVLHPQALEVLYQMIKKYDADVSAFEIQFVPDDFSGDKNSPVYDVQDLVLKSEFSTAPIKSFFSNPRGKRIHIWDKLYRLEAIKGVQFPLNVQPAEDTVFTMKMLLTVKNMVSIDKKLLYYRENDASVTKQGITEKYVRSHALAAEVMEKFFNDLENVSSDVQAHLDFYLTRFIFKSLISQPLRRIKGDNRSEQLQIAYDFAVNLYNGGALKPWLLGFKKAMACKMFFKKYYRLAKFLV